MILVDNGSTDRALRDLEAEFSSLSLLLLGSNQGIAHAQNEGLAKARTLGMTQVLLLDQDSVPEPGMTAALQDALDDLQAAGRRVGAVGALQVDDMGAATSGFSCLRGASRPPSLPNGRTVSCDTLIASGTLVPMAVFDDCGAMDRGLFIDKVDTEWCLRVRARGYEIHGVPDARLGHRLGERTMTFWLGRPIRLPVHKPFRYYFMVRNSLLVRRMPHATPAWRAAEVWQLLKMAVFLGAASAGRGANARMMWRGLIDGVRGVSGPMPRP